MPPQPPAVKSCDWCIIGAAEVPVRNKEGKILFWACESCGYKILDILEEEQSDVPKP